MFQAAYINRGYTFTRKNLPKWVHRFLGCPKCKDAAKEKAATRKGSGMDYLAIFSSLICEVLSFVTVSRAVTLALISSTSSAT